jgi:hypothetical protein
VKEGPDGRKEGERRKKREERRKKKGEGRKVKGNLHAQILVKYFTKQRLCFVVRSVSVCELLRGREKEKREGERDRMRNVGFDNKEPPKEQLPNSSDTLEKRKHAIQEKHKNAQSSASNQKGGGGRGRSQSGRTQQTNLDVKLSVIDHMGILHLGGGGGEGNDRKGTWSHF